MEFVAVFALSAIVAVLYNWIQPKVFGVAKLQTIQANYFGKTLLTAVVIFGAIVVAGFIFSTVDGKAPIG
jgi:hypothetical protein